MASYIKTSLLEREKEITQDPVGFHSQFKDLVLKAFQACIVRDVIGRYRYGRAEKLQEYNVITTFSHVALENYALLQLCKLFDEKSVYNVWYVPKCVPYPELKKWFDEQIRIIEPDISYLSAWRGNFVGHRSAAGHFAPRQLEEKFNVNQDSEKRVKEFLLNLLCRINFEIYRCPVEETKEVLLAVLYDYKRFVLEDKEKVLLSYD